MLMVIDWIKLSEIVFQAILTAIISAGLVYLAFRLGQRQAREEQKEKEEYELNFKRIDALTEVNVQITKVLNTMNKFEDSIRIMGGCRTASIGLLEEIDRILHLFPISRTAGLGAEVLNSLKVRTKNIIPYIDISERVWDVSSNHVNDLIEYHDILVHSRNIFQNTAKEFVKEFG